MEYEFKTRFSISDRRIECERIRENYPDKIPVICEKDPKCKLNPIDKTKFLISSDITVAEFGFIIRKRIFLNEEQALFILFQDNKNPPLDCLMSEVYEKYKDPEDGYLYAIYSSELMWG